MAIKENFMFFVWSWWYLVIVVLLAGIVALSIVLVKMNQKDVALLEEFQQANAVEEVEEVEPEKPVKKSTKKSTESK